MPKEAFISETKNLKYMWDRHSEAFLATYIRKSLNQPQPVLVRKIILHYLNNKNKQADVLKEERFLRPISYLYINLMQYRSRFLSNLFHKLIFYYGIIRAKRLNKYNIKRASLLDIGCGAGNHYNMFILSSLNLFLDYTGIDISDKNISICNKFYSKNKFQTADFKSGNILKLDFENNSFEIVMVNNLFEHLSPRALPTAISEAIRVAKDLVIVNFFNERDDISEHDIRPIKKYYWNCLSRGKIIELLMALGVLPSNVTFIDQYAPFYNGRKIRNRSSWFYGGKVDISRSTMIIEKGDKILNTINLDTVLI